MLLALLYLLMVIFFGCTSVMRFVNVKKIYSKINFSRHNKSVPELLFIVPSGSVIGILITTFICYFIIYFINYFVPSLKMHSYDIAIILLSFFSCAASFINLKKIGKLKFNHENWKYYLIVITLIIILSSFLIFYGYFMRDSIIYMGPTINSDLSPHTALTEAFGNGGNIPTQYMHFSNDGIRYHFMFYFFTGLLKYLKMPLDLSLNIPSIIGIVSALMLIGLLANLITNDKRAFLIAPLLVLFRSSLDIFDLINNQSLLTFIPRLISKSEWYNTTPYDEWGLWAINVYANQRHLMFGIAILLIVIMTFIPYFADFLKKIKKYNGIEKIKFFFLDKDNWKISDWKLLLFLCIIIIALPYFHGSVLISLLLILFWMAIFSENRLSYLIIAIAAVCSSYMQTSLFSGNASNVVNFMYMPGFVLGDCSLFDILKYLIIVTGITFVLGYIYAMEKGKGSYLPLLSIIFIIPTIFAFLFKVSFDVVANHKFIQISLILFSVLTAGFLVEYFKEKGNILRNIFGLILIFLLTATGVSEWFIYINMNKYPIYFDEKSEVTTWIRNNTALDDTFLTPYWALSNVYLSGRQIYYGWPYYAWSAGHDTDGRYEIYKYLLTGCNDNIEEFTKICKKEKIKYFVDTDDYYSFEIEEEDFHREYITNNLKLVKDIPNEGMTIYQIY